MSKSVLRQDPFFSEFLDEVEAEGIAKGTIETRIADLVAILKARGWVVADHIVKAAREADSDTLGEMITTAVTSQTLEQFTERFGIGDLR